MRLPGLQKAVNRWQGGGKPRLDAQSRQGFFARRRDAKRPSCDAYRLLDEAQDLIVVLARRLFDLGQPREKIFSRRFVANTCEPGEYINNDLLLIVDATGRLQESALLDCKPDREVLTAAC